VARVRRGQRGTREEKSENIQACLCVACVRVCALESRRTDLRERQRRTVGKRKRETERERENGGENYRVNPGRYCVLCEERRAWGIQEAREVRTRHTRRNAAPLKKESSLSFLLSSLLPHSRRRRASCRGVACRTETGNRSRRRR